MWSDLLLVVQSLLLHLLHLNACYSSKELGALYYDNKRHLGEKVQKASILKLVEEG